MMNPSHNSGARTLGLFEKRFDGDDSLMELARRKFLKAGMGAEVHGGTVEQIESVLRCRPGQDSPVVVHLPRDFNLVDDACCKRILDLAARFAGLVQGMVLHDHESLPARETEYIAAAWKLESQLERIDRCPLVFLEYAAGLALDDFTRFLSAIRDLDTISACLDIGHVGIRCARAAYAQMHPGEDIFALKSQGPQLPPLMPDVDSAVASGVASVLDLIDTIAAYNKPVHFHLHDGHPLSTVSPFGVSDHLSFLAEIPLNFEYQGRRAVKPMFGPSGLRKVVTRALDGMHPERVSFTLEIHPTGERLELGDDSSLFKHWQNNSNAEKMSHWLAVLVENHRLLREAIEASMPPAAPKEQTPKLSPAEPNNPESPRTEAAATPESTESVPGACEI